MANPVIVIPSPRRIPEFLEATAQIRAPKLWIKNHSEEDAYAGAREWFLGQPDFTHFVILPDDLIITQQNYDDLKSIVDNQNVNVLSGWCRNTIRQAHYWTGPPETEDQADTNLSYKLPPDPPRQGKYDDFDFIPVKDIENKQGFIKVKFSGFALTFISRAIIEKIPFRTDYGCCVDSTFSLDLDKYGIDQYVYLNVRTTHLQTHPSNIEVGKKEKEIYLEM